MLYALKIATRYLTASKAQTALLVLGVAVGVFIFIISCAALIRGAWRKFILSRTVERTIQPCHHRGRGPRPRTSDSLPDGIRFWRDQTRPDPAGHLDRMARHGLAAAFVDRAGA